MDLANYGSYGGNPKSIESTALTDPSSLCPTGDRSEGFVAGLPHGEKSMLVPGSGFEEFWGNYMNLKLYSC